MPFCIMRIIRYIGRYIGQNVLLYRERNFMKSVLLMCLLSCAIGQTFCAQTDDVERIMCEMLKKFKVRRVVVMLFQDGMENVATLYDTEKSSCDTPKQESCDVKVAKRITASRSYAGRRNRCCLGPRPEKLERTPAIASPFDTVVLEPIKALVWD